MLLQWEMYGAILNLTVLGYDRMSYPYTGEGVQLGNLPHVQY